jgi:hypothetical protein
MLLQYQDLVLDDWIGHCTVEKQCSSIQIFLLKTVLMVQIDGLQMEDGEEHGVCISV